LPPIEVIEPFDSVRLEIEAALKLYCSRTGAQMKVNYGGAFGESASQHRVKAELACKVGGGDPAGFPAPADR
jgi:hypothetical protein